MERASRVVKGLWSAAKDPGWLQGGGLCCVLCGKRLSRKRERERKGWGERFDKGKAVIGRSRDHGRWLVCWSCN